MEAIAIPCESCVSSPDPLPDDPQEAPALMNLIQRPAPDFSLEAVSFGAGPSQRVTRDSYAGQWLLLLFYPRDFSFVCPTELTAFSAHIDAFRSRRCAVLGVSVDTIEDHQRWLETPIDQGGIGPLRFPLAADVGGRVSRDYGVWLEETFCSARGLFMIDPEGCLQYAVVHSTSVGRSTEEILRVVDALQSGGLCPASWTAADGTIDVEQQLHPGRVLGHFRIVERLGSGAFGNVFSADDLALKRRVAIKIIGRDTGVSRDTVLAEARAAAQLQHPNICTVFTVDTIDAVPVIVMEYIDGQQLADCDLTGFGESQRRSVALGIAQGLAVAHARGVVHGDLKPANIMLSRSGEPKLLDFGLARRHDVVHHRDASGDRKRIADGDPLDSTVIGDVRRDDETSRAISLSGTPAYMSPEQTQGQAPSFSSDVFSFGLILVELLTGRSPVKPGGLFEVLDQIHSGAVRDEAVSMVPDAFRSVVASLLERDPDQRPELRDVIATLRKMKFAVAG